MVFVVPPEKFSLFEDVYLLTYMFKGSETEGWFNIYGLEYEHLRLDGSPHSGEYSGKDFQHLINIFDDRKMNSIGTRHNALSRTWFTNADKKKYDQLKNNMYNFFHNICATPSSDNMWSCPKDVERKLKKSPDASVGKVSPKTLEKDDSLKCFVAFNSRATNNFAHKKSLAYVLNVYPIAEIVQFFNGNGIKMDQEQFALSSLYPHTPH